MQLSNSFTVPVPVDEAWRVLLDVERVAPCMPGATVDSIDGDEVQGRVKVKVGPITVTYRGTARFVERDEQSHTLVLEASGREMRGSGTAKATMKASFAGNGEGTKVTVTTDLAVTGKPAQFGRGVMSEVSAKLIDQFAACLADEVTTAQTAASNVADEPANDAPVDEPAATISTDTAPAPAAAPLPPSGAPQEPAAAPATPIAAAGTPAAAVSTPTTPSVPRERPTADAIDLLGTAGVPVLRRVAPVAGALGAILLLILVWRRRK